MARIANDINDVLDVEGLTKVLREGINNTFTSSICEFIDNSIDADADEIRIYDASFQNQKYIIVSDNGTGIDDLSIVNKNFSSSKVTGKNKIGKWGIGGSAAGVYIGDVMYVISQDKYTYICADKAYKYEPEDGHNIPQWLLDVVQNLCGKYDRKFTYIICTELRPNLYNPSQVVYDISHTYSDLIPDSIRMFWDDSPIQSKPFIEIAERNIHIQSLGYMKKYNSYVYNIYDTIDEKLRISYHTNEIITQDMYIGKACMSKVFKKHFEEDSNGLDIGCLKISTHDQNAGFVFGVSGRCSNILPLPIPRSASTKEDVPIYHKMACRYNTSHEHLHTNLNKAMFDTSLDRNLKDPYLFGILMKILHHIKNEVKKSNITPVIDHVLQSESETETAESNPVVHCEVIPSPVSEVAVAAVTAAVTASVTDGLVEEEVAVAAAAVTDGLVESDNMVAKKTTSVCGHVRGGITGEDILTACGKFMESVSNDKIYSDKYIQVYNLMCEISQK